MWSGSDRRNPVRRGGYNRRTGFTTSAPRKSEEKGGGPSPLGEVKRAGRKNVGCRQRSGEKERKKVEVRVGKIGKLDQKVAL